MSFSTNKTNVFVFWKDFFWVKTGKTRPKMFLLSLLILFLNILNPIPRVPFNSVLLPSTRKTICFSNETIFYLFESCWHHKHTGCKVESVWFHTFYLISYFMCALAACPRMFAKLNHWIKNNIQKIHFKTFLQDLFESLFLVSKINHKIFRNCGFSCSTISFIILYTTV